MRNLLVISSIAILALISVGCDLQAGLPYATGTQSGQQPSTSQMRFRSGVGYELVPTSAIRNSEIWLFGNGGDYRNYSNDLAIAHMSRIDFYNYGSGRAGANIGKISLEFDSTGLVETRYFNIYSDAKGQFVEDMNAVGVQYKATGLLDVNWLDH